MNFPHRRFVYTKKQHAFHLNLSSCLEKVALLTYFARHDNPPFEGAEKIQNTCGRGKLGSWRLILGTTVRLFILLG